MLRTSARDHWRPATSSLPPLTTPFLRDGCESAKGISAPNEVRYFLVIYLLLQMCTENMSLPDYYHNQDIDWSARLHAALAQTQAVREQFINAVTFDQEQRQRLRDKLSVDLLM